MNCRWVRRYGYTDVVSHHIHNNFNSGLHLWTIIYDQTKFTVWRCFEETHSSHDELHLHDVYLCLSSSAHQRLQHTLSSDRWEKQFHTRILTGGTVEVNLYKNIYKTPNHVNQCVTIGHYVRWWSKVSHVSMWECVSPGEASLLVNKRLITHVTNFTPHSPRTQTAPHYGGLEGSQWAGRQWTMVTHPSTPR